MTIKAMIEFLTSAIDEGRAQPSDLVIIAEYDRIHLRPSPLGYLDKPITMTREERPLR